MAAITALTVVGWATSSWHGVDMAVVALLGALAITIKPLTGLDMKSALKKVEWNLLIFLAATLAMGHALLDTGAAQALSAGLMSALGAGAGWPVLATLSLAALLALLSHLVITSRTARALSCCHGCRSAGGHRCRSGAAGHGVCGWQRLLPDLAGQRQPVALFAAAEVDAASALTEKDLLRLSAILLLPLWMLLLAFALWIWPWMGVNTR